ncbi:carbohydrate-binding protein [Paenibacillus guangzhouensis]|uniref:carbohydrate-binding protein n=1 Tax=Paenibacillus guangzhouensis TaxID=1473112 RepID=UPI00126710EB|nr:carbohydrate-binding protein [Paenibacillus guangzhouensis]
MTPLTQLTIEIHDMNNNVLAMDSDQGQAQLVYHHPYQEGDQIVVKSEHPHQYLCLQLDDAMPEAFVYLATTSYRFTIPFGEKKISYSPKSFSGGIHAISVRLATAAEISSYKNVALNPFDQHENNSCYPHALANVETRGESVFAARNAIDGNCFNAGHGAWPFESWGINQQDDAEMSVQFGRTVEIDCLALTLRADFPHDNYWKQVTVCFSNGDCITIHLTKTNLKQVIKLEPRRVESLTLKNLIKSDDPSPFPALTQIEVYGNEVK